MARLRFKFKFSYNLDQLWRTLSHAGVSAVQCVRFSPSVPGCTLLREIAVSGVMKLRRHDSPPPPFPIRPYACNDAASTNDVRNRVFLFRLGRRKHQSITFSLSFCALGLGSRRRKKSTRFANCRVILFAIGTTRPKKLFLSVYLLKVPQKCLLLLLKYFPPRFHRASLVVSFSYIFMTFLPSLSFPST